MAAVEVRRRRLDRQVREAELFVHADLRPHARVAVERPRVLFPRLVAEFAGARNRVEPPELLARAHVVRPHRALRVVVRRDRHAFSERRSDEHDVAGDDGRRVDADLAGLEVDLLVSPFDDTGLQIDDAARAERVDRLAGLRVERDEPVTGRHVQDALVAAAVGPVGDAAARELTR